VYFVRILKEAVFVFLNNMNQMVIVMEKQPDVCKIETEMLIPK